MAGRILNRRELRRQADQAEPVESPETTPADAPKKAKAPAAPRVKKPRAKKAPPRMRARWGVFDMGMKQIAIFDYNQRTAADEKLAEMLARQKGTYFLQIVKEPMPEETPAVA